MKEIIEYILAALIIVSTIPIYNYIVGNLYQPPELQVDYSLLNLFTLHLTNIIEKPFIHGNASSPIFSFEKLVEAKLKHILTKYGYCVEIVSSGLMRTFFDRSKNSIIVETLEPGTIHLLILYRDGGRLIFKNVSRNTFDTKTVNNTYIYSFNTMTLGIRNPDGLIYILAVLETPSHRYVNYYLFENKAIRVNFTENNGVISIATTSGSITADRLNATIVFYNQGEFHLLNRSFYEEPRRIAGNFIEFYKVELTYMFKYSRRISIDTTTYNLYDLIIYVKETITRVRIRPTYEEIELVRNEHDINVYAPVYNLVLAVLYDNSGNIYLTEWYPHRLVFGHTIPRGMPVSKLSTVVRIGMIDYLVTIYMWRVFA